MISMQVSEPKHFLLTGATGLLGRYLMKDLTLAGVPLAVHVRPNRRFSAQERIEAIFSYWDQQLGTELPRPKVLSGQLGEESLGMVPQDISWAAENCSGVIHNAASLSFVSTGRDSEPYISNVGGTQNVLKFCQEAGIYDFHHVSTAYVCGLRTGVVLETELNEGQEFGNPYEESKVEAEEMTRQASFIKSHTVYRPSIIVGDSQTGFTNTFHGFYAAVQLVNTMCNHSAMEKQYTGHSDFHPGRVTLDGTEDKNFVPVDWVSSVMSHIISTPQHHGKTYHLTPRNPVRIRTLHAVLQASAKLFGTQLFGNKTPVEDPTEIEQFFYEHIRVYDSYWRNDPTFDATNTRQAAPHLPCPHIDYKKLLFLARHAIEMNFSWRDKLVKRDASSLVAN